MKIHLSNMRFDCKPTKDEAKIITNTITGEECEIDIKEFAKAVGEEGRTFTPALFHGKRCKENFKNQQVFVLDFDGGISTEEFFMRAEKYEIRPAVLYETFSSDKDDPKFRVVFINDVVIEDRRAAEIMNKMICLIFPEADQSCKDVARMFYGGKKILYCEEKNTIDIYNISLSLQAYIRDNNYVNYARNIKKIANELGVWVSENHLLGIYMKKEIEEKKIQPSIIIQGNNQNSSKFYIIELENEKNNQHHRGWRKKIRNQNYYRKKDIRIFIMYVN